MKRSLPVVIDKILMYIPANEKDFANKFREIKIGFEFSTPEVENEWWKRTGALLNKYVGPQPFEEEWKELIMGVWTGQYEIN